MTLLSRADILRAFEALARELEAGGATTREEIVVAGFFISRGYEEILFPRLRD